MKASFVRALTLVAVLLVAACDLGPLAPAPETAVAPPSEARRGGGKKPKPNEDPEPDPEPEPDPVPDGSTWQLEAPDDHDPLWRFTRSGNQMLLQTDPSVTSWGTDYWGYWSDPFAIDGQDVAYTIGLTHTTYTFVDQPDGRIDVTKTLIVQPYLGGSPTTTVTHVGVFAPTD